MAETYLDYVSSVLGLNLISATRPVVLFEKSLSLQSVLEEGPASELLEKILSAIGWKRAEVEISEHDFEQLKKLATPENIVFTSVSSAACWDQLNCKVATYHPSELLNSPNLKKTAWESLQKARR